MKSTIPATRKTFKSMAELFCIAEGRLPEDAAKATVEFLNLPCVWEAETDSFDPTCVYDLDDGFVAVTSSGYTLSETGMDFSGSASEFIH